MTTTVLKYKLQAGYIHHWLAAGPQSLPIPEIEPQSWEQLALTLSRQLDDSQSGIDQAPVELGALNSSDPALSWRLAACAQDHFLDLSAFYPTCQSLQAWAYAGLHSVAAQEIRVSLTTFGPANLWLNGEHLCRQDKFQRHSHNTITCRAMLKEGANEIVIRLGMPGFRETAFGLALEIQGVEPDSLTVELPTMMETQYLGKRRSLEAILEKAAMQRFVFGWMEGDRYHKNEPIVLSLPEELQESAQITLRMQDPGGKIYQEAYRQAEGGAILEMAQTFPLHEGEFDVLLMPLSNEYYVHKIREERRLRFYMVRASYASQPYGDLEGRRQEALKHAAGQFNPSLYSEIARFALGTWEKTHLPVLRAALAQVEANQAGCEHLLTGLLGLKLRFGETTAFPAELLPAIEAVALGFEYHHALPAITGLDSASESSALLLAAGELLAGQLYPEQAFNRSGETGRWHQANGEQRAMQWIQEHGRYGFADWDSSWGFADCLVALSHLMDLAASPVLRDLSAVMMDKIFTSLAINSFQGAFGSTHGVSQVPELFSSRLGPASGIARLMWGLGNFNQHIAAVVSLACDGSYELPETVRQIATHQPDALWHKERHAAPNGDVNKVIYKTGAFMLASAQDYRPGEAGSREHIWQATLGPEAVAFVNHPACASLEEARCPNFWRGNRSLPRVAQWGDALIAVYCLPEEDWMGYTHAYFPAAAFDEHLIRDGWAFARKGKGYLALTAAAGLQPVYQGRSVLQELRSNGLNNVWLCQMGQALVDGSFADFCAKVISSPVNFDGLGVSWSTVRGEKLSFGWQGPLLVNGEAQAITGFGHYESEYAHAAWPAEEMIVQYGGDGLRLVFT